MNIELRTKARELGISEDIFSCSLEILYKNKNLVNAIDNRTEMDEYIYRAIIKRAVEKRKAQAETELYSPDSVKRDKAEKDLSVLSKEELFTDPYYRAVLPTLVKIVVNEPILRLHAEEAAALVLTLADFKRSHRATSVTEVFVKKCSLEIESLGV